MRLCALWIEPDCGAELRFCIGAPTFAAQHVTELQVVGGVGGIERDRRAILFLGLACLLLIEIQIAKRDVCGRVARVKVDNFHVFHLRRLWFVLEGVQVAERDMDSRIVGRGFHRLRVLMFSVGQLVCLHCRVAGGEVIVNRFPVASAHRGGCKCQRNGGDKQR